MRRCSFSTTGNYVVEVQHIRYISSSRPMPFALALAGPNVAISNVYTSDIGMTWVANAANAATYTWHDFSCGCEVPLDWDGMVSTLLQGPYVYPDGPSLALIGPFGATSFKFHSDAVPGTTIEALELTLNTLSFFQSFGRHFYDANWTFRILGEGEFIPEPSTWLLALCGVLALVRRRVR